MSAEFLPSQVVLSGVPLVGTMGRTEREIAAAYVVRACQFHGDRWQPVTPHQIALAVEDDVAKGGFLASIESNPFARPDFHQLVAEGFASGTLAPATPIELTPKGLEALRKWVRS